jgi:hypothetical protein
LAEESGSRNRAAKKMKKKLPKLERKEKMNLSIKIPWSFVENAKKY